MSKEFKFEQEKQNKRIIQRPQKKGGMIGVLLKLGFINTIRKAKVVLFAFFILIMSATFVMIFTGSSPSPKDQLRPPKAVTQQL